MLNMLAVIDPEVQRTSVTALISNPWLWTIIALMGLLASVVVGLLWSAKTLVPKWQAQIEADRKARAEQKSAELKARAEEKAADRAMWEKFMGAAVTSAAESARLSIEGAHKEIGERVVDVKDAVAAAHETARQMQRQLAGIAAKVGAPMVLLLVLLLGSGSLAELPPRAPALEAKVGTTDPGQPLPAPGRAPSPARKDCDPRTCRPPSVCRSGECQGTARKPPPQKLAGQVSSPSSLAVHEAWQDSSPEAFPARLSDAQWLAGL